MKRAPEDKKFEETLILAGAAIILILTLSALSQTTHNSLNDISANALSTANISPVKNMPCNFTLEQDYNLVSFFCITLTEPLTNVVQNITQLEAIFEYQEGQLDPWKSYNPNLPSYVIQDLQSVSRKEGYWIEMNASELVYIQGGIRLPTSIEVVQGWNLVGYPSNNTKNITFSLASLQGNYSEVRGFNAISQSFLSHTPPAAGGLTHTTPYQGYWINVNATTEVWIVD